jgi:hypothetical protein
MTGGYRMCVLNPSNAQSVTILVSNDMQESNPKPRKVKMPQREKAIGCYTWAIVLAAKDFA